MNDESHPIRGIPTPLPRRLSAAPANVALKQVSVSASLVDQVKMATAKATYKRRGPRAHQGPPPTILELRRAAEKREGR